MYILYALPVAGTLCPKVRYRGALALLRVRQSTFLVPLLALFRPNDLSLCVPVRSILLLQSGLRTFHEETTRFLRYGNKVPSLVRIDGERFFAKDMFACP